MKKYLLSSMLLALFAIGFTTSDQTDLPVIENENGNGGTVVNQELTGIVKLADKIGNWDAAYLTKFGYFAFSKDVNNDAEGNFSSLSYMSPDGS